MFGFPIMKPSFSFTNVKTITITAICSEIILDCFERLMRKKDFASSVLKNDPWVNTKVEFVHLCSSGV